LIIAEEFSSLSYIEGCSASKRIENQLHAAVVEIVALKNSRVKYSTVQNWYPGDEKGNGGIYNFVTKRGICKGINSKISWIQVETGSSVTWKYPSTVLLGESSVGEFYSITISNHYQQADTGTKMIHIGKNTKSTIVSKGISSKFGKNTYRGMVKIYNKAENAANYSQCDSLLFGKKCSAYSFPILDIKNNNSKVEHEAFASKISDEQLFYCEQRGIEADDAVLIIVGGFCKNIFNKLPTGFLVEAEKLIKTSIKKS
jgi:Fe-S cluster assembly protein SufB